MAAACSDGGADGADGVDEGAAADPSTTLAPTSSTAAAPTYTGDPDSPFCVLLRDADLDGALGAEVTDPDAIGEAFRSVVDVLVEAATLAPPEIVDDVALVADGMGALDEALAAVGYDFDALAASGSAADVLDAVNDPAFAEAGTRLAAYRTQACQL